MKWFAPRLYRNCSLLSKSCGGKSVALTGKPQMKAMNSWKGDESWIYEYDVEQREETERFAETEKITKKQIKNQSHVDGFGLPWNCAPRIRACG